MEISKSGGHIFSSDTTSAFPIRIPFSREKKQGSVRQLDSTDKPFYPAFCLTLSPTSQAPTQDSAVSSALTSSALSPCPHCLYVLCFIFLHSLIPFAFGHVLISFFHFILSSCSPLSATNGQAGSFFTYRVLLFPRRNYLNS